MLDFPRVLANVACERVLLCRFSVKFVIRHYRILRVLFSLCAYIATIDLKTIDSIAVMHDPSQTNIYYTVQYGQHKRQRATFQVDVDLATELRMLHEFLKDETKVSWLVDKMPHLPICIWTFERPAKVADTETEESEAEESEAEESEYEESESEEFETEESEAEESETDQSGSDAEESEPGIGAECRLCVLDDFLTGSRPAGFCTEHHDWRNVLEADLIQRHARVTNIDDKSYSTDF